MISNIVNEILDDYIKPIQLKRYLCIGIDHDVDFLGEVDEYQFDTLESFYKMIYNVHGSYQSSYLIIDTIKSTRYSLSQKDINNIDQKYNTNNTKKNKNE